MMIDVIGKATLRQTASLLKRCLLYVGNDTGPMHLAAAAGIPVVEISSFPRSAPLNDSNSPARFRPWGASYTVLQPQMPLSPCTGACEAAEAHCIKAVSIADVQGAIVRMFA